MSNAKAKAGRNKAGRRDLTFGTGTETQIRGGERVEVEQINAQNIPFDHNTTLLEAINNNKALILGSGGFLNAVISEATGELDISYVDYETGGAETFRIGRILPIHQGVWTAARGYITYDIVEYFGSSYMCATSPRGRNTVEPPADVAGVVHDDWKLLAAKGGKGDDGDDGNDGNDGNDGVGLRGFRGLRGLRGFATNGTDGIDGEAGVLAVETTHTTSGAEASVGNRRRILVETVTKLIWDAGILTLNTNKEYRLETVEEAGDRERQEAEDNHHGGT